jgi:hypothetical protein
VKLANYGLNYGFEDIIVVQFSREIPQFSVIKMHRSFIIKICTAVSNRGLHYALHCSGVYNNYDISCSAAKPAVTQSRGTEQLRCRRQKPEARYPKA